MKKCVFYTECKKEAACRLLGECVFGHEAIKKANIPQALINIHYSKGLWGINNVFFKIKKRKPFNGETQPALDHLNKIIDASKDDKRVGDGKKNNL